MTSKVYIVTGKGKQNGGFQSLPNSYYDSIFLDSLQNCSDSPDSCPGNIAPSTFLRSAGYLCIREANNIINRSGNSFYIRLVEAGNIDAAIGRKVYMELLDEDRALSRR